MHWYFSTLYMKCNFYDYVFGMHIHLVDVYSNARDLFFFFRKKVSYFIFFVLNHNYHHYKYLKSNRWSLSRITYIGRELFCRRRTRFQRVSTCLVVPEKISYFIFSLIICTPIQIILNHIVVVCHVARTLEEILFRRRTC